MQLDNHMVIPSYSPEEYEDSEEHRKDLEERKFSENEGYYYDYEG